jgi:hypothetical protein
MYVYTAYTLTLYFTHALHRTQRTHCTHTQALKLDPGNEAVKREIHMLKNVLTRSKGSDSLTKGQQSMRVGLNHSLTHARTHSFVNERIIILRVYAHIHTHSHTHTRTYKHRPPNRASTRRGETPRSTSSRRCRVSTLTYLRSSWSSNRTAPHAHPPTYFTLPNTHTAERGSTHTTAAGRGSTHTTAT